ncbi:MAG: hypothetical protein VX341_08050 [Bdellovibrionota bacterium]|nr:hypothetical protein [Bdellovibrionota bacterium]
MKKFRDLVVVSSILISPMVSASPFDMTLSEAMSQLDGDKHFCSDGDIQTKRCSTDYSKKRLNSRGNTLLRQKLYNVQNRNQWILENSDKFRTPTENERLELEKKRKSAQEKFDDINDDFKDIAEEKAKYDEEVAKLKDRQEKLKVEAAAANEKWSKIQEPYMRGEISKKEYQKARKELERIDIENEELKGKIRKANLQLLGEDGLNAKYTALEGKARTAELELHTAKQELDAIDMSVIESEKASAADRYKALLNMQIREKRVDLAKGLTEEIVDDKELSETLMGSFEKMQKELELDEESAEVMLEQLKLKYENSMLKELVQSQIDDTITNKCPAINACVKGQISDLSQNADQIDNAVQSQEKEGSGSDVEK